MNSQHASGRRPRITSSLAFAVAVLMFFCTTASAVEPASSTIAGRIVDASGNGVEGVMVSAIDDEHRKWTSVFTRPDGTFAINGLRNVNHHVRT